MILSSLAATIGRTDTNDYDGYYSNSGASVGVLLFALFVYFLIFVVAWAAAGFAWAGAFKKAGYEPWKAFVPFYNTWIMVKMTGRPESHFWFTLIPYFNIYMLIVIYHDLSKSFGKDTGFTVGLVLVPVVFAAILSYSDAKYLGPSYVSPEQKAFAQQQFAQQQYGQQQYGQQPDQYGQQQYGQQPVQYGQATEPPQYGANPPAQPGYGAPENPYAPQDPFAPQNPYAPQNPNGPANPYNSGPTQ